MSLVRDRTEPRSRTAGMGNAVYAVDVAVVEHDAPGGSATPQGLRVILAGVEELLWGVVHRDGVGA